MMQADIWPRSHTCQLSGNMVPLNWTYSSQINVQIYYFQAFLRFDLKMTFDLRMCVFGLMNLWRCQSCIHTQSLVLFGLQFFKWDQVYILSRYLTTWSQVTLDVDMWNSTLGTQEDSHVIYIHQAWFQSDFHVSNETSFTLSTYLTTWLLMTFDLGMLGWTSEVLATYSRQTGGIPAKVTVKHTLKATIFCRPKVWSQSEASLYYPPLQHLQPVQGDEKVEG